MKDKEIIKKALGLLIDDGCHGFRFSKWIVWIPERDEFLGLYDDRGGIVRKAWSISPAFALDLGSSLRASLVASECASGRPSMIFESNNQYMCLLLDDVLQTA